MTKIVVTGYGVIASKTQDINAYLNNLQKGVCCLDSVEGLGPENQLVIAGLIGSGLEEFEKDKQLKRLPRVTKIGVKAAREALKQANIPSIQTKKVGLFYGTSLGAGGEALFQNAIQKANEQHFSKTPVTFSHFANYHSITSAVGHYLGINGMMKTISTGCTSSLEAIQDAMTYLKSGLIDVAIVGGSDSPICRATTYAFARTKIIPLDQSVKDDAIPFCQESSGFAMSEAGGVLVLEREETALERGASIRGEIVEIISNNDGVYIFSVEDSGKQMIKALREIVLNRSPDYVNSQALGIQINDRIEERSSEELFQHHIPYTSIKSMYGNPFGAIGVLQVISSLLSIQYNFIPPTIRTNLKGYETMNIVTDTIYQEVNEVVITNHGHGGNNACAYIRRY